jgi:hypothetical protein
MSVLLESMQKDVTSEEICDKHLALLDTKDSDGKTAIQYALEYVFMCWGGEKRVKILIFFQAYLVFETCFATATIPK